MVRVCQNFLEIYADKRKIEAGNQGENILLYNGIRGGHFLLAATLFKALI
jgi:hypothetical protein